MRELCSDEVMQDAKKIKFKEFCLWRNEVAQEKKSQEGN